MGWPAAILVDVSDSTVCYTLHAVLTGPMPLYWSCPLQAWSVPLCNLSQYCQVVPKSS